MIYRDALRKRLAEATPDYTGIDLDEIDVLTDEFEKGGQFKNHPAMLKILRQLRNAAQLRRDVEVLLHELEKAEAALASAACVICVNKGREHYYDKGACDAAEALASLRAALDEEEE